MKKMYPTCKILLCSQLTRSFVGLFIFSLSINLLVAQTIDLSKPVGSPMATSGSNGSGGVVYSIPIEVLPGINGMQPTLSLNYNSAGKAGDFGYGWFLSGGSSISRAGKSNYYNGITKPVSYTNSDDAFVLDGQRLFVKTGTNGANGATYGTEKETFAKIESFGGSEISGPSWFRVTTKEGSVMEYGSVANTRYLTDDGQSTMVWLLYKVTDRNGNYIIFKYNLDNTNRNFPVTEIDYTGNTVAGIQPMNKILFTYTVKPDWQTQEKFSSGASYGSPFLLNNISIINSVGTTIKSYQPAYTQLKKQYFLTSFTEKGADGKTLNPIKFTYGNNTGSTDVSVSVDYGQFNYNNVFTGDITGDGKDDIVAAYLHYDNNDIPHYNSYYVFDDFVVYGGQAGMHSAYEYKYSDSANNSRAQQINSPGGYYNFLTLDYDGDAKKDVLMSNWTISSANMIFNGVTINYSRYYSSISGVTYERKDYANIPHSFQYTNDFKYSYHSGSTYGTNFIPGDFDGDGAMDYILILGINPSNSFKAFFSSPAKGIINEEIANFGVEGTSTDPFYATSVASAAEVVPMDFDGDGKTEILVQKANQSYIISVFPVSIASGFYYAATKLYTTASVKTGYRVFPGDFNGDGSTDLLVRNSKSDPYGSWNLLYSTGKAFKSYPFIWTHRPYLDGDAGFSQVNLLMVNDLNGDGRADVWISRDEASGGLHSEHVAYYSNGIPLDGQNSTTAFTIETYSQPQSVNKSVSTHSIVGDINGDSKADLMSLLNTRSYFIYSRPFKEDHLMTSVTDGFGRVTSFDYALMNSGSNYERSYYYYYDVYGSPIGQSRNGNPYNVLNTPMYILREISSPNGIGGYQYTTFNYKDATFNPRRGFLGFKQVSQSDATGVTNINISEVTPSVLLPHTVRQLSLYGLDTLSDIRYTDTLRRLSSSYLDKRYVHEVSKVLTINGLTGAVNESSNTYDGYGNITANTIKKGYLSGSVFSAVETAITTTTYGIHGSPVPSLPESVIYKNTRIGHPQISQSTTFTYDTKGNNLTKTNYAGSVIATTTNDTYDSFGNIKTEAVNAPGALTPAITNTYDNTGRYLTERQTSGSGITKTETFTYDPIWGSIATSVSSDGLTTSYYYDNSFGRLIKTTYPDGNSVTNNLVWENSGNLRYSITTKRLADGGMYSKDYYDILGRVIKRERGGFNDQLLTSTSNYNYKGQLVSKTEFHYSNEPVITTTNTFDNYGRPTGSSNGTSSISIEYDKESGGKYKVTTTNGSGQASSKTQDASGRIITANDNGGQLNFTYDSWGCQKTVTLGGSTLITSNYDAYGRRISLVDKNSGTTTYEYNSLGKVTKQTDALGHIYTVAYDAFGRVISHHGPEGTVSYVYYKDATGTKNNDNISKITGFSGDVVNITYDNLGREIVRQTIFDGLMALKYRVYDSYGNLIKTKYPDGLTVFDTYDKNHNLLKTEYSFGSDITKPLFEATAMNSRGVVTGYSYGNGKSSTVTYDLAKGVPTRFYTAGIQDLQLTFDGQTNNLLTRKDAIKNLTETFTYDNLNRLTGSKVNNVQQFTLSYDNTSGTSLGNIKSKSDVGNYVYDNNKINAVKYITSTAGGQTPPSVVSHAMQDITYTSFSKVATINENGYNLSYTYGQDEQRIKSVLKQGSTVIETKYYLKSFERQIKGGVTRDIHYVNAGNGLCAIIVNQGGAVTPYFVYCDHLGSILTVTDTSGNIVASQNFDAWGRKRNHNNWLYTSVPNVPDWLYRGYTGHEYLAEFVLINMNGRLYDPVIGRMISPDNFVPLPWNTQGYNRYGYANNNPLLYIDPNGNLFGIDNLIGAVVGAVVGGVINVVTNFGHMHGVLDAFKYFGAGAAGGLVGGATMNFAWAGGITGGLNALIGGGGIGDIAESAALGVVGGAVGGAVTGKIGGILANTYNIPGGIINGAISGGIGGFASGATVGGLHASLHGENVLNGAIHGGLEGAKFGGAIGGVSGGYNSLKTRTNVFDGTTKNYKTSVIIFPPEGSFVNETTDIAPPYPYLNRMGPEELHYLPPGMIVDRYGETKGHWLSEPSVSFGQRSIPPYLRYDYHAYQVMKPLPVWKSIAAPGAFDVEVGFGVQYQTPVSIAALVKHGFLREIER